jgi:hypothetical protein
MNISHSIKVTFDKSVVFYGYSSFFPPIKLIKILLKVKVALNSINQTKPLFAYGGVQHILCCVLSNILSYHMSVRSEFPVVMFTANSA